MKLYPSYIKVFISCWMLFFAAITLEGADLSESSSVIRAIANTNYHVEPGLKVAKLYELDPAFFSKLQEEIVHLVEVNKPSDVNQKNHVTHWTKPWGNAIQYSLLNRSGRFEDTSVDHNSSVFQKAFHHEEMYPYLAQFIRFFPHATNFRINVMGANSGLSQHEECSCMRNHQGVPMVRARFHLPIQTNPLVYLFVDQEVFSFKEGSIYFFNNGGIHSSENNDPEKSRIHLVWDMLLTEDTFNRMFARKTLPKKIFQPVEKWTVPVEFYRPLDPAYAGNHNGYSLEEARATRLCDLQ